MPLDDIVGERLAPHRARIVPEALPRAHHVGAARFRQRRKVGKTRDEPLERRHDAIDLRLLKHELADAGEVRAARPSPRSIGPAVARVPGEQFFLKRPPASPTLAIAPPLPPLPSAIS